MAETSPLRRRMIEDMTVRNLSPATQRSYVHAVSKFSQFFGRSPETLTLEDVRTFQVHLAVEGCGVGEPQPDGGGAAVFLRCHARDGGDPRADRLCPRAAASAGGAERRRGGAVPRGRSQPEGPRRADHSLCRRAAGLGGHRPEGRRHRQRPDDDPHRARQGRQGALRDAVGAAAGDPAHLLAAGASRALAVSGARRDPPDRADDAACGLPVGAGRGGDRQEGDRPHPAAQLRHPSAGERRRHSGDPGAARPRAPVDHGALHPCLAGCSSAGRRARWSS